MSDTPEFECNAIIESACVRFDRDAFLSMWVFLKFQGGGQGFGGYVLGGLKDVAAGRHSQQPNICAEFIVNCLLAADAESVDKMAGKTVRVRKTDEWGDILAIGHIVRDDRWFYPKRVLAAMCPKSGASAGAGGGR